MRPNVVIASACEAIQGPQPQPQPNDLLDRRVASLLAMTRPPRRDAL
jgi:hypothetical protein